MKKIIICLIAIVSIGEASAQRVIVKGRNPRARTKVVVQPVYSPDQLTGKWQEVKRSEISGGRRIVFTDSLQLNFNKRDSVIIRDGITMSQRGAVAITGDRLAIAGDSYSIRSLSKNTLVLNDGVYIREFSKRKNFYYENMGKVIIQRENISDPVAADVKKLSGKWYVYRTQATPGAAEDSAIIKIIKVINSDGGGNATGEITFTKNTLTQTLPFQATFQKGMLHLVTDNQAWHLNTYKADGKEFIFGNQGGLVYFSKKL